MITAGERLVAADSFSRATALRALLLAPAPVVQAAAALLLHCRRWLLPAR